MADVSGMNLEFLKAVKGLTDAVRDFLNDDGSDDGPVVAMNNGVYDVLTKAREIPALQSWANRILAADGWVDDLKKRPALHVVPREHD